MDYFTKWVETEAKALANFWDVDVKKFVWKNIVTRFGVLESLFSDNGLQFDSKVFCSIVVALASQIGIPLRYIHRATVKPKPLTRPL